ncbi:Maf family protein [Candidatus Woesearchaeota archaeon]|nr:Maf family protein [Candidatus Woesearchaeota archaeon]
MRIILASQSLFRKKALEILGLEYETIPSNLDEQSIRDDCPYKLAKALSEAKAKNIGESDALIIAGDLFVVFNNKIYEKPADEKEAFDMLKSFSGNKIDIVAGVAVYNSKSEKMLSTVEKYTVKFRKLEDYEINDYISRYPVLKLSAAFEGDGLLRFAESVEGKYPFLTGFPLNELILFLRENGLKV